MGRLKRMTVGFFVTMSKRLKSVGRIPKVVLKKTHHIIAGKPHQFLMNNWKWYRKWHDARYHSHIHISILVPYLFIIFAIVLFSYNRATFAADVTTTWDFTTPSSFVFDGDSIEISGTTARLKDPYSTLKPTIDLADADMTSGVKAYSSFAADETPNGGSINYRLSSDDGVSWRYWDGADWATSSTVDNANTASDVNDHILSFPVTFKGIKWQAILISDGSQQVTLNSITIIATSDVTAPNVNASSVVAKKVFGGSTIASNAWTNGSSPYFGWTAGNDTESGILGYCLYLGQDGTANPVTTKGLLGSSLIDTGGHCQFATSSASLDLAVAGVLASPLTTSTSPYYIAIKAIDKAGNLYPTTVTFQFRFDNTPPNNPGFISAPSGFINTRSATLTWPTSGSQAASDTGGSGIAGLQYQVSDTGWFGDAHNNNGDMSDLLTNDGSYTTIPHPDFYNLVDGINMVYFRTWDQAGNVSASYVSAALKINTSGSPSIPLSLTATPTDNSENVFSFSWAAPATFVGDVNSMTYCYTVNTLPSDSTCNYTAAGVTSLPDGPYATQPNSNTMYVVGRDESGNINYDTYSSVIFSADTFAPGIISNLSAADISERSTSNWRLAIAWEAPSDSGTGVNSYKIYRSTNDSDYSLAGTSTSTTYIDAGLIQQLYYYRVTACDSTNNCSADSPSVSMTPTGRFTEPANIVTQPEVSNITTKRAIIQWVTDRGSDSSVLLGTKSGEYSASEISNSDQVSAHKITLDNLVAGTTYYFKVKWTDVDSNTGESQESSFTTKPAPVVKEVTATNIAPTSATINFTSIGTAKVNLYYGMTDAFGGLKSINTSANESKYSIDISSLKDGTKYYYQLSALDSEGSKYDGNVFSFTTPALPRISNLRFQPITGQPTSTQSVTWMTNVPTTSIVTYGKTGTDGTDIQIPKFVTDHKIVINDLHDNSKYFLIAQGRDTGGNLAVSDQQVFKTALDTRPPTISDVTIQSSIVGTGSQSRGQVIVSWKTDEPATSQVGYAEGSTASVFDSKTSEDTQLTTEHTVILSDLPTSKVYSIQAMSYDKARNLSLADPQPAVVGHADESVLTIILSALQRVFGF